MGTFPLNCVYQDKSVVDQFEVQGETNTLDALSAVIVRQVETRLKVQPLQSAIINGSRPLAFGNTPWAVLASSTLPLAQTFRRQQQFQTITVPQ
jgi:hypothetical protein